MSESRRRLAIGAAAGTTIGLAAIVGVSLLPWRARAQGANVLVPATRFTTAARTVPRAQLTGACDLQNYLVATTNGAQHTIKWPKNAGTCQLSVFSLDANGQVIQGSAEALGAGKGMESYTSAAGAAQIAFSCSVGLDSCVLELDR
jgi:hypothetical protein